MAAWLGLISSRRWALKRTIAKDQLSRDAADDRVACGILAMKPLRLRRPFANWPTQRVYWKCMEVYHILGLAALTLVHLRNCFESVTGEVELRMRLFRQELT